MTDIQKTNDFVKSFEGFSSTAYLCPAKKWTIGYGNTLNVKQGDVITEEEASQNLSETLDKLSKGIKKIVRFPLNESQLAALTSFVYNIGWGNFKSSNLLKQLNMGYYDRVPMEMIKWIYINKVQSGGLYRRRQSEVAMWNA